MSELGVSTEPQEPLPLQDVIDYAMKTANRVSTVSGRLSSLCAGLLGEESISDSDKTPPQPEYHYSTRGEIRRHLDAIDRQMEWLEQWLEAFEK